MRRGFADPDPRAVFGLALPAHRSVAVTASDPLRRLSLGHAIGSVRDISGRDWALAVLAVAAAVSMRR